MTQITSRRFDGDAGLMPATQPIPEIKAPAPGGLSTEELAQWQQDLQARLARVAQHPEQGLGFMEEQIRQSTLELQRKVLERAMQAKADAVDENCPCCQSPLIERKRRVRKTIHSYCGGLQLFRTHGWCKKCEHWVFPADQALGLLENSTASPLVQEMSALLVSKMPCEQAEAVAVRLTGLELSRSTLAREAQRQGDRAIQKRQVQAQQPISLPASGPRLGLDQSPKPFTLILQIDAWNIRERDDWGKTQAKRERGEEIKRWHWVYTATCFRLEHRLRKGKRRAVITERSYVATRQGIDALVEQLHAEAMRRGLAQAERVLVIADGAAWIWKAAKDRFGEAIQRLDLFHANSYLWAVANEIHGAKTAAARRWVKPLLRQVRADQVAKVIASLEELKSILASKSAELVQQTIDYYTSNQSRMKYAEGEKRGEPIGSGAIESTCRQLQCRMKRCGQFWSTAGDEALLCLEVFWRNDRWQQLFPHAAITAVTKN